MDVCDTHEWLYVNWWYSGASAGLAVFLVTLAVTTCRFLSLTSNTKIIVKLTNQGQLNSMKLSLLNLRCLLNL